jgi:hypothetical protein
MKHLPDQKPKWIRLDRAHIELIAKALSSHAARVSLTNPPMARLARRMRTYLPKTLPYELEVLPTEWETLSQALRPEGSTPLSEDARCMYALYTKLRKVCVFVTQGDMARIERARKRGRAKA